MGALSLLSLGSRDLKITFFANSDWNLFNFDRFFVKALLDVGHEVVLVSSPGPYGEKLRAPPVRWVLTLMERRRLNALARAVNWIPFVEPLKPALLGWLSASLEQRFTLRQIMETT